MTSGASGHASDDDDEDARPIRRSHGTDEPAGEEAVERPPIEESDADRPKRSGWWQRRTFF
jgi:hypothetical protein